MSDTESSPTLEAAADAPLPEAADLLDEVHEALSAELAALDDV